MAATSGNRGDPGTPTLSPVFLDNHRVTLQGDPRPPVSKILEAGGKGLDTQVLWVREPDDDVGRQVSPSEVIDRTLLASQPVHFRSADLVQQSNTKGRGKREGRGASVIGGSRRGGPTEANTSGGSMEPEPKEGGGWNLQKP